MGYHNDNRHRVSNRQEVFGEEFSLGQEKGDPSSAKPGGQETMLDVDLGKLPDEGQGPDEVPYPWNQVRDRVIC